MGEIALRFALGGLLVSLFALAGEVIQPKTLAGVFGSAPSVALGTLAVTFASRGIPYAEVECRSMIAGAVALVAYGAAVVVTTRWRRVPVWAAAGACWLAWAVVAFALWALFLRGGG
jgi:hypothetical protein